MDLSSGNIFEAMRLVLPEHRELMNDLEQMARIRQRPELTEDALAEYEYIWREALINQHTLSITMFSPAHNYIVQGIPLSNAFPLRLCTTQGSRTIARERIIHIERL